LRFAKGYVGNDVAVWHGGIRVQGQFRFPERTGCTDSRGNVSNTATCLEIQTGIVDRSATEQQLPAVDLQLPPIGLVGAAFYRQAPARGGCLAGHVPQVDGTQDVARQSETVDADVVTQ
jgi:hypothetical protein